MLLLPLFLILALTLCFDLKVDPRIKLIMKPTSSRNLIKFYETFPPIDDVIIQNFHFITLTPLIVNLHDRFCTGASFRAYDNFRILINEQSILNFCGISANNLLPIVSPDFREVEFYMDAGEHYLVVVVLGSPIGNKRTSLRITLKPVDGEGVCNVVVAGMETKSLAMPKDGYTLDEFNIEHYRSTGKLCKQ